MSAWGRIVVCAVLVMAGPLAAWAQETQTWDRYLDRPRGPYRARVVDAQTKAPLAGAVVVALWRRDRVYPFHLVSENYAVLEAITDTDGRFVLDANDVEERAPRRTNHPEFIIFLPGYGAYPWYQVTPTGFTAGIFERSDTVVELRRLESNEDRRRHLRRFDPYGYSETPFKNLPELMRRLNAENISIGLDPYTPRKD